MKEVKGGIEKITKKIEKILNRFQEIEFAYLFGSFLERDGFRDIDIALYVSKNYSPYEVMKFSLKIGRELEKAIKPRCEFDVKILNYAPLALQYEVIKTGRVVFCKDEAKRIRYEAHILSSYLDYKVTSDWLDREFLARV
jgi:predicted nucleotidyltransferase